MNKRIIKSIDKIISVMIFILVSLDIFSVYFANKYPSTGVYLNDGTVYAYVIYPILVSISFVFVSLFFIWWAWRLKACALTKAVTIFYLPLNLLPLFYVIFGTHEHYEILQTVLKVISIIGISISALILALGLWFKKSPQR